MAQNKVFCKNCKYYLYDSGDFGGWDYCRAPRNYMNTYRESKSVAIKTPSERNRLNRCTLYVEKVPLSQRIREWLTT